MQAMTQPVVGAAVGGAGDAGAIAAAGGNVEASVPQLNALLRGEISAAETYRMAIDKAAAGDNAAHLGLLRQIQEEHGRAAQGLRDRIEELGGQASDSSGAWGVWARTIQGAMNLFGDNASIGALKEGEEHGLNDYTQALSSIDPTSAQMIRNQLIPAQQRHIERLEEMLNAATQPQ